MIFLNLASQATLIAPIKRALDYYQNMANSTEDERKKREERKLSSGTPPRKLSAEKSEQNAAMRKKSGSDQRISPTTKRIVGNGPVEPSSSRKSSAGCNSSERKISSEHITNGPMIVGN